MPSLMLSHSGPFSFLTVHHAGSNSGTTGPARYRSWQNYHMDDREWGDVAYHYIVGKTGIVWEARDTAFRGDTGTNYDPDRHVLVVVEGAFESGHPTAEQLQRLPVVLAWAAQRYNVPTHTIGGHRDYAATLCPGANLYSIIRSGGLKAQVDAILNSGGVVLT